MTYSSEQTGPTTIPNHRPLWILVAVSLAALLVILRAEGWFLFWAILVGWVSSIIAFGLSLSAKVNPRPARGCFSVVCCSLILLVTQTWLVLNGVTFARRIALASISEANLKYIARALEAYVRKHHEYPPSYGELGLDQDVSPRAFLSPSDTAQDVGDLGGREIMYSSYVYRPCRGEWRPDPGIVLAHDYIPWQPLRLVLSQDYGYLVLFGDGRIRCLERAAFVAAMEQDAIRRRELGWPTLSVRPVGEVPASAPASTAPAGE